MTVARASSPSTATKVQFPGQDGNALVVRTGGEITLEAGAKLNVGGIRITASIGDTIITGTAGTGTGSGGGLTLAGGPSGSGAHGNGGDLTFSGGTPLSTSGNGGNLFLTGADATGNGDGGSLTLTAGAPGAFGTPGVILIGSQPFFISGTPTIPTANSNTISGSDQTGIITIGAGATTSVDVTFGGNNRFSPTAVVLSPANAAAAAAGVGAYTDTLSATGWTLHGTALANCAFNYHAF